MDERVRRMWAAAKYQPSAKAGISTCSGVPEPEDGSQPRYTEKNRIISSPTQNCGIDSPRRAKTLPARSQTPLTRTAARMPLGIPMRSENVIAAKPSSSELGSRDQYSSSTGVR